ncbi:MAG: hypothetical protein CMF48_02890 [Legionellales bacterium]|nr:hypothetical protein [Legionellales bacterium]
MFKSPIILILLALQLVYMPEARAVYMTLSPSDSSVTLANQFTLTPSVSVQNGEHKELVYTHGYTLSELVWPVNNALLGNLELEYQIFRSLGLKARFSHLIQSADGTVTDTDWDPEFSTTTPIIYSSGRSELVNLTELDLEAKLTLFEIGSSKLKRLQFSQNLDNLKVSLLYGVQNNGSSWRYWGGEQYYNPNGITLNSNYDDIDSMDPSVVAIRYSVQEQTPYVGSQIELRSGAILVSASAKYSNEAHIEDMDEHRLRSTIFYDSFHDGEKLQLELYVSTPINDSTTFWINGKQDKLFTTKGDTVMVDQFYYPFEVYTFEGGSGINHKKQSIMAGFDYRF